MSHADDKKYSVQGWGSGYRERRKGSASAHGCGQAEFMGGSGNTVWRRSLSQPETLSSGKGRVKEGL